MPEDMKKTAFITLIMHFPVFIYTVPFLFFIYMKMKYNMQLLHSEIRDIN